MANPEHLAILAKGVESWNEWRRLGRRRKLLDFPEIYMRAANLRGANLRGANLPEVNLCEAQLREVDLSGANLRGAKLINAKLFAANLHNANLSGADLRSADLSGANLSGADLSGGDLGAADLNLTELRDAKLSRVKLAFTVFRNVDLSVVTGLDSVAHSGPSTIGLDTIYMSQGKIPDVFLRGAGTPESFITYMKSLTGAFDFYSCFISYSSKDQEFADRLYADLQAKGVRCWFAPHDIQGGRKVHEQIDEAIRVYDKLLLILSPDSMNSPWVKTEIANARAREVQQERRMLFPISVVPFECIKAWKLFDADTGIDSAREIREYFVPDFSDWKNHDLYGSAFERLLRDLKAAPVEKAEVPAAPQPATPHPTLAR